MANEKRLIDATSLAKNGWHLVKIGESNRFLAQMSLADVPTVDAVEVVHGHWDEIPNKYMSVSTKKGSYSGHATSCSVCHEVNPNVFKTNYCPNCGAKMDGVSDG